MTISEAADLLRAQDNLLLLTHNVPENREKIGTMLLSLGRDEVYGALKERSVIVIRDDLSNHEYRFDKADIDELFRNTPETPPTVH